MDYSKFINAIETQDKRNIINKTYRQVSDIPKGLVEFFNQYDPIDVEIVMKDLSAVKLYSYLYLHQLQSEYNLEKGYFVFATKNSDPIAIFNQKIVALAHGSTRSEVEEIAKNFEEYVCKLMEGMRY